MVSKVIMHNVMVKQLNLSLTLLWACGGLFSVAAAQTGPAAGSSIKTARTLLSALTLYPEYSRYKLQPQAQLGDNCWAYSIIGCLELEFSRARHKAVTLSGPFLVWAAARSDADAPDAGGSNFGRAARALERFGICTDSLSPALNVNAPGDTRVSSAARRDALNLASGIHINWIRFCDPAGGLTGAEMQAVKQTLAAGHPVAIGMRWPKQLRVENQQLHLLATCKNEDEVYDGHCVTLIGYEESDRYAGGGAFIIRNTWGPDWMEHGHARLPFQYVQQFANDLIAFKVEARAGVEQPIAPTGAVPSNVSNGLLPWLINLKAKDCKPDTAVRLVDDDIGRYKQGVWFQNDQVFCSAQTAGQGFTTTIAAPETGSYNLVLAGSKAPDYGTFSFSVDGRLVGTAYDFSWANVEPTGSIDLGTLALNQGIHTLRIECQGKSLASHGFLLGLDWIALLPQPATVLHARTVGGA